MSPRPRRAVLSLLASAVAAVTAVTAVAGCVAPSAPTAESRSETASETSSPPDESRAATSAPTATATPLPPDTVAFASLSPRTRRVVENAIITGRGVADHSVVERFRDAGHEHVRYEGRRYRLAFEWIVSYDIRPQETNCSEADPDETVAYENLSVGAREAFETGLDAGEYEARDYAFPAQLRRNDYVRRNRTCFWLYRLHGDTSMYEVRATPASS